MTHSPDSDRNPRAAVGCGITSMIALGAALLHPVASSGLGNCVLEEHVAGLMDLLVSQIAHPVTMKFKDSNSHGLMRVITRFHVSSRTRDYSLFRIKW